ncbi:MAG: HPr kinase/phosphorylase [Bacilli bacterium]|nr:HPr kinase/phosphorylase [Bacilli bacterium]
MAKEMTVAELAEMFDLVHLNKEVELDRVISVIDINRPGLALAGFFKNHPKDRIQLLGNTELQFLLTMEEHEQHDRFHQLCSYEETPCILVSRKQEVTDRLTAIATSKGIPLLQSPTGTTKLTSQIERFLDNRLAPETQVHGVLVDVYGIGILMIGASGIGKSETALELIKRGHRLVADDAVEIRQVENSLIGSSPELLSNLLEIRGLGVLNAMTLFGAGAVRTQKRIEFVIELEVWQDEVPYDRLGLDEKYIKIIDTELPAVTLPVRPGRNLAVIIEVAAMNQRLKRLGFHAARELSEKLMQTIEGS